MANSWTDEQKAVIDHKSGNLLVAAAAGSGKTAVLSERVLELLKDEKAGFDVDRLLVVTFTRAAAAEMRDRIGKKISDYVKDNPENTHMRRQATLINNATIATIDSFCNQIVHEYFHVIDLAQAITVEMDSGASYPVTEIVDFSNLYDLAILKIDVKDHPYLELAEKDARTGEQVYAVGSALGTLTGSFTGGMVSSTKRTYGEIDCIQMDAAISPGNSGGPLVNVYGEVVGINTASYTRGENLNLAIKVSELDRLAKDKNWSVKEFKEWYEQESSRSWSPTYKKSDGSTGYLYSLVNNYQTVTGAKCLQSCDNGEEGKKVDGYRDMFDYYVYAYNTSEYDKYVEYLKSVGFEYEDSETKDNWTGTSYYYYNEKDEIMIDLYVLKDFSQIWIWPTSE